MKILNINKATLDLLEAKSKKEVLKGLDKVFTKDSFDIFKKELVSLLTGKTQFEAEAPHLTFNGNIKIIMLKLSIVDGYEDNWGKILISLADITERIKTEQKLLELNENLESIIEERTKDLKESRERYRLITENANDMISVIKPDLTYEYINESAFMEIIGRKKEHLLGKNALRWVHPDDLEKCKKAFKLGFKTGKGSIEARFRDDNNQYHWFELKGKKFVDFDGEDKALIISRDITDRKEIENEIQKNINEHEITAKKLKDSEEKYRTIFQSTPDYIYISDIEGTLIDANKSILDRIGIKMEDLRKKKFLDFFAGDNPDYIYEVFNELLGGKEIKGLEVKARNVFGEVFLYEVNSVPLFEDGKVAKILNIARDITEKKAAEQALRESEEKFRTITEQSFMGIIIIQDGLFKYFNQRAIDINGYSAEEVKSWEPYEFSILIHPEDSEFVMEQAKKKEAGINDVINRYTYRIIKKSGEIAWMNNYSKSITFNGRPADLVMTEDITEKVLAEKQIKESEERYRLLFENMNSGFAYHEVIVNEVGKPIDYRYLEVNPVFERLTNMRREELIGKKVTEAIPGTENDPADWIGKFGNVGLTGIPLTVEDYSEAFDRWYEVSGYSPKKGFFAVTFTDITKRVKAMEKLKESEEKYRNLFETANDAILILDTTEIIECNDKTLQIFGYSNKVEIIGKQIWNLSPEIQPDGLSSKEKALEIHKFVLKGNSKRFYWKNLKKDGTEFDAEVSISPIKIEKDIYIQAIVRDITEKKKAEQELIRLNNLKSDLLTRSSHELKTPLLAIRGFIDLLLMKYRNIINTEVLDIINHINSGSLRLETLVRNIIITAELESGASSLKISSNDIVPLIKECLIELKGMIESRNHTIQTEFPDKLIFEFDSLQIKEVLNNLLLNAIKYTPPYGLIKITSEIDNNFVVVSIEDNGIGFTKDEMSNIFQRFGKIERFGQGYDIITEGSGLGLYYSKKIIELHGGELRVKSAGKEKGSVFYIILTLNH